jgi:hypothetical protein
MMMERIRYMIPAGENDNRARYSSAFWMKK